MANWMVWALAAAAANVAKVAVIKQYCRGIDSRWVVFAGRLFSAAALMPAVLLSSQPLPVSGAFWLATSGAAVLTAAASVMYTDAIKRGALMVALPTQAAVPMFTLLTLWVCRSQTPPLRSNLLMVGCMAALGWMLYAQHRADLAAPSAKSGRALRYAALALFAAALFGVSTALDRVAVAAAANGALVYSAYWNALSAALMALEAGRRRGFVGARPMPARAFAPLSAFGVASLAAFFCQQRAVQNALAVAGSVVPIKAVVMLHLPLAMLLGAAVWRQRASRQAVAAGLIALALGIGLILSAR